MTSRILHRLLCPILLLPLALIVSASRVYSALPSYQSAQEYKELNKGLTDAYPEKSIRVDDPHPTGGPQSRVTHGHVGPVDHIPIKGGN